MSHLVVILPPDDRFVPHEEELVLEPAAVSTYLLRCFALETIFARGGWERAVHAGRD